jgi:DNA-binding transcriptional MerR regulator
MLKVGEVARRTGLTVRTLHHYDEIGLLRPGARTAAGHRLYGRPEIERLQQIRSLKQLGLSLEETRACLDDPGVTLARTLAMHRARLEGRLEATRRLHGRLVELERRARRGRISLDDLLGTIEETTILERYYTAEQRDALAARRAAIGEERIRAIEDRWADLAGRVSEASASGIEPTSAVGLRLAREWKSLAGETVAGFTGGDEGLEVSLRRLWSEEPDAGSRSGIDADVRTWIGAAIRAL